MEILCQMDVRTAAVALLQAGPPTPERWVELLSTYGPMALFVFMVLVLLQIARKMNDLGREQRKVQLAAFALVWTSIFVLAVVIVLVWWRVNFPSEFVVKGVLRNLRDPEMITTRQEMYLRVYPTAGLGFEYQWRFITPQKFTGYVTLILQKRPGSRRVLKYQLPIRPEYYRSKAQVEIAYVRETDEMTVTHNGRAEPITPALDVVSNDPPREWQAPSVVLAHGEPDQAQIEELMKGLDADNPAIREKAHQDLLAHGVAALPAIERLLNSGEKSSRMRAGTLAVLAAIARSGSVSLPDSLRCAVARIAAADPDRFTRSEAARATGAGVRPGGGCLVPPAIDELKTSWAPVAIAYHRDSGLFALDQAGRVYRVGAGEKKEATQIFSVPGSTHARDIAAGPYQVLVAGNAGSIGQLWVYALAPGKLSQITLPVSRRATGLALEGNLAYVGTASGSQFDVEVWDLGNRKLQRVITLPRFRSAGSILFDGTLRCLLLSDPEQSRVSALSLADGRITWSADRVGIVTAAAAGGRYYLLGSGGKILFRSRSNGAGENPPPGMEGLNFRQVSGLAVDDSGDLWVSDFGRKIIKGPIVLR